MSSSQQTIKKEYSCICTGQIRQIAWHGERYDCVSTLLEGHPELLNTSHAEVLAELLVFLQRGRDWELILDIPSFKQQYKKALASSSRNLDLSQVHIADYGVFDVSILHLPKKEQTRLTFFACDTLTGLPYKATFNESDLETQYEPLPRCG